MHLVLTLDTLLYIFVIIHRNNLRVQYERIAILGLSGYKGLAVIQNDFPAVACTTVLNIFLFLLSRTFHYVESGWYKVLK